MNKKYNGRAVPIISDEGYDWQEIFLKNLQKNSVQPIGNSIHKQISQIMGNSKAKYPSVEAAVEDMKERSGLNAYLKKIQSEENNTKKIASHDVILFKKYPEIKNAIDNYCQDTKGNIPIIAIIEKMKDIYRFDIDNSADFDDPNLLKYINSKIIEVKNSNPGDNFNYSNLGRVFVDKEDKFQGDDLFQSLVTKK